MNYQLHYDNLISTRKQRIPLDGVYYEKHHIIMKSMGGTNDSENIVKLTAREHFLAHWLLWRIHRNRQAASAFFSMCRSHSKHKRVISSSRAYSEAREGLSLTTDNSGDKNPFYGKHHSEETRIKMSTAQQKVDRTLMPQHLKGRKLSVTHKAKINPRGRKHSLETKKKMAESRRKYWENKKSLTNVDSN
jgi:hypothetical protein